LGAAGHDARRGFLNAAANAGPRRCQTRPATAPGVITAPVAIRQATGAEIILIAPQSLFSEMTMLEPAYFCLPHSAAHRTG
jgi:hypothetical protein